MVIDAVRVLSLHQFDKKQERQKDKGTLAAGEKADKPRILSATGDTP
jgi:hypothetical protein